MLPSNGGRTGGGGKEPAVTKLMGCGSHWLSGQRKREKKGGGPGIEGEKKCSGTVMGGEFGDVWKLSKVNWPTGDRGHIKEKKNWDPKESDKKETLGRAQIETSKFPEVRGGWTHILF